MFAGEYSERIGLNVSENKVQGELGNAVYIISLHLYLQMLYLFVSDFIFFLSQPILPEPI